MQPRRALLALVLALSARADPLPGRVDGHGMVLFGAGATLYASHIPAEQEPGARQAVFAIRLHHPDLTASRGFDEEGHTLKIDGVGLDALLAGTLKQFTATVYRGSFETDGVMLFKDATVEVTAVLLVQPLAGAPRAAAALSYFALGSADRLYLVHRLTAPPPRFDQVLVARTKSPLEVPAKGVVLSLSRPDNAATRLLPGDEGRVRTPQGQTLSLVALRELSFLRGPEFTP